MGAHRRRFIRQRSKRARGNKTPDTASLGGEDDDSRSSLGSWESDQPRSSAAQQGANSRTVGLSKVTLTRHPAATSNGSSAAVRGTTNTAANKTADDRGEQPLASLPPYHPDAACSEMMGYAGRLSWSHEAALGGLRQWLTRESVDLAPLLGDGNTYPPEEEDLALLRFLRHNAWDVELTRVQIETSLSWRAETGVPAATRKEPWEVSGCTSEESFERMCRTYYPHHILGTDRVGRPVLVQKYGSFDTTTLQKFTTLSGLLRYHAWEQEKNAELLRRATARTGYLVETYTVIMDFKGMTMGQINRDFLWLLRGLSEMDRNHFPGRGGVIYVINTPPMFGLVWQGIRGFLTTQARVHFFSKESEWRPALAETIDPAFLPVEYGGNAPSLEDTPLLPSVHRALELGASAMTTATAGMTDTRTDQHVPAGDGADVAAGSMCRILRCFSPCCDGSQYTAAVECSVSVEGNSGANSGSLKINGIGEGERGGGGGRERGIFAFLASVSGTNERSATRGDGVAGNIVPKQESVNGHFVRDQAAGSEQLRSLSSSRPTSSADPNGSVVLPSTRRATIPECSSGAAPSMAALPTSKYRQTSSSSSSSSSSSQGGIVRQRSGDSESVNDNGEGNNEQHGDLEWVLDVIPGARFAATVAGTVAGAALGATLGAAGFAAGVVEAVVPGDVWAEGMQTFQSMQFIGGWALGR